MTLTDSSQDTFEVWRFLRSEVPGSPVFMMQLCAGARHIEVQIMGR